NGEYLIGASVFIKDIKRGVLTNQYGFYSITLPSGNYNVSITFVGYKDSVYNINLNKDIRLNISMNPKSITTQEVVISAEKDNKNIKINRIGTIQLSVDKIKTLPAFLGEVDIMKSIQLMPGIQNAGEGNSAFYVRGGGPDENLVLLDDALIYNPSHLFGFFSIFNSDAVKNMELIKAGMPANYGGRLASVVDISTKEGNNKNFEYNGGLGLISSRLTIEGPIKKDTGSFLISGRRTYADLIMQPFLSDSSQFKGSGYYFYDLNAKANYRLSDKDRIFISGYFGRDVFSLKLKNDNFNNSISWGNSMACLRWNHLFNNKLFINSSFNFSDYSFDFSATQGPYNISFKTGVRDVTGKFDFTYFPDSRNHFMTGGSYTFHTFTPDNASAKSVDVSLNIKNIKLYSLEGAYYLHDDFDITENLKISGGLRYSIFSMIGPFDRYVQDAFGNNYDTIHYGNGEFIHTYNRIEPRFSTRLIISKNASIKAAYTENYQYVHLASISGSSLPTDIWIPCSDFVKPEFNRQYSLGFFRNFLKNTFETSIEVYYKQMKDLIEYKEGTSIQDNFNNNIDNNFTFGNGKSYGIEFFINKKSGKLTGWIGYTLSWAKRQFDEINNGQEFYAKYDRRHDVSFVSNFELNKKWTLSLVWVYATGNAITLPIARYFVEENVLNEYGSKNWFRMPPYHRMDISATYYFNKHGRFESNINFSIYNVYNRYNPYYIYFETSGNVKEGTLKVQAKQISLFPILPSVTWNFKF
ncbi:MAG: TonB-dependent receptor, partial [Bacteroidota bacterium]|nr:TonB-dependent receptor [Bacteroidota bacterium]